MRSVAIAGLVCLVAAPAFAEDVTVEVQGSAPAGSDLALARNAAVGAAQRAAIEQLVGEKMKASAAIVDPRAIEERVLSRASQLVKKLEVLSELKDGESYLVKVRAVVDKSAIASALDELTRPKPRVVVLVAEQNVGAQNYSYWWGSSAFVSEMDITMNGLIEAWTPKGFKFIEPSVLKGKIKVGAAMKRPELSSETVLSLARTADADIAVVGKVTVTDAGPVMEGVKMRSFHAVGTLRVLNVSTGEILGAADDSAVAPHIDANQGGRTAIKALLSRVAPKLEEAIAKGWGAASAVGQLEIEVRGLDTATFAKVDRFLREESGVVEGLEERSRGKGKIVLVARIRGKATELARLIEGKFEAEGIRVQDLSKDRIVVSKGKT
ncbi:MAG: hypothetical protein HY791_24260 [Deltaproteobacteria bacterium]|nr:hypothetical protein [Deltaproteobacteria bacterium]